MQLIVIGNSQENMAGSDDLREREREKIDINRVQSNMYIILVVILCNPIDKTTLLQLKRILLYLKPTTHLYIHIHQVYKKIPRNNGTLIKAHHKLHSNLRGSVGTFFLLSLAAFPANSRTSAQRYSNTALRYTGAPTATRRFRIVCFI